MTMRSGAVDVGTDGDGGLAAIWGNQQAEHSHSSFSSAVKHTETTPSKRRRGSDGLARRKRNDHDPYADGTGSGSHSRSRTVDDEVRVGGDYWMSGRATNQHPLRTSASEASSSSWTLDHDTRPMMKKLFSDHGSGSVDEGRAAGCNGSLGRDQEKLVIVHEIQPKDSLAGVALKYRIALAELRRANQLWTSDSIHVRKVLYIPVDKTRQVRQLREALLDAKTSSDTLDPFIDTTPASHSKDSTSSSTEAHLPDIGKLTLRRVPASQLSYFPPSTYSSPLMSTSSSAIAILPNKKGVRSRPPLPIAFHRTTESTLQGVLDIFSSSLHTTANNVLAYSQSSGALFGGPSVRAPTTLASRLSLDSNSGTPSSVSDDFDWEHEMEVVTTARAAPVRNRRGTSSVRAHARKASASLSDPHASPEQEERDSVELDSGPFTSPPSARTQTRPQRRNSFGHGANETRASRTNQTQAVPYAGEEPVAEWSSPRAASVVRTAQMEPSPGMQLPLRAWRRTKSRDS